MKIIYILCEGATEATFANNILADFFNPKGVLLIPLVCTTSRTINKKYVGGVSRYSKIKHELYKLCKEHSNQFITTMFDYYALPSDTPNIDNSEKDVVKRVSVIEEAVEKDLGFKNLKFNVILHEFEALLFSDHEGFASVGDEKQLSDVKEIKDKFISPEHINNNFLTAPSKRLRQIFPKYNKVSYGTMVSNKIGIHKIMQECTHFRKWIELLLQV